MTDIIQDMQRRQDHKDDSVRFRTPHGILFHALLCEGEGACFQYGNEIVGGAWNNFVCLLTRLR